MRRASKLWAVLGIFARRSIDSNPPTRAAPSGNQTTVLPHVPANSSIAHIQAIELYLDAASALTSGLFSKLPLPHS